jgi:hypothetical protein
MEAGAAVSMEPEEYCARVLAAMCGAALEQLAEGGSLVNTELPETWSSISELFGVSTFKTEISDGKLDHRTPRVNLQADAMEPSNASERMREVARRILDPIYKKLETARLTQSS